MIVFTPTWLWLILIPANYLIDRIVLSWSLGDYESKNLFCRKHTWKICIAGFAADFIGSSIIIFRDLYKPFFPQETILAINYAVYGTPFASSAGLIVFLLAILIAGICVYFFDRLILIRAGLEKHTAVRIAVLMAVITAPYTILIPTNLFY